MSRVVLQFFTYKSFYTFCNLITCLIKRYTRRYARNTDSFKFVLLVLGGRSITVVKVLCYKSEGRWFDPSWCQWMFSLT